MYWNKDMLCIKHSICGLTLTWDVLKFVQVDGSVAQPVRININMRCIEINVMFQAWNELLGLTLTWDVLKFVLIVFQAFDTVGLTLTWDVLKFLCGHDAFCAEAD